MKAGDGFGLYVLVDGSRGVSRQIAKAAIQMGLPYLQLRMKEASDREICQAAEELLGLCCGSSTALLINDRVDLALAVGAHGVHVGQGDLGLAEIDLLLHRAGREPGKDFLRGVSTHSLSQLADLHRSGASLPDYAGFGPIWPTPAKRTPDPAVGPAALAVSRIPLVAIGSITPERIPALQAAGVRNLAMIRAIHEAPDPPRLMAQIQASLISSQGVSHE